MLPFLKNRDDGVGQGPAETIKRDPDDGEGFDILDAVAEDLLMAIEKKDKGRIKSALESLVSHIQNLDEEQDQTMEGGT